jgi:hypothetical protein
LLSKEANERFPSYEGEQHMASIYLETTLAVAPDALWATVRDVGSLSSMLDVITESSLDGDVRTCKMGDGGELSETILSIDEENRRVGYTITASPLPIDIHASSMQVIDAGAGKSTFRWITDVKPDAMAEGLGAMLSGEITQLEKRYGT